MKRGDLYDSDLNSDAEAMNFGSDDEPPQEQKWDKKKLLKEKELKIYKQIYQVTSRKIN